MTRNRSRWIHRQWSWRKAWHWTRSSIQSQIMHTSAWSRARHGNSTTQSSLLPSSKCNIIKEQGLWSRQWGMDQSTMSITAVCHRKSPTCKGIPISLVKRSLDHRLLADQDLQDEVVEDRSSQFLQGTMQRLRTQIPSHSLASVPQLQLITNLARTPL